MLVQERQRKPSTRVLSQSAVFLLLIVSASAALRARHKCTSEASVAKVLGYHPECVELLDGPTCSEETVRDGGCRDTRAANFTVCGAVLVNEVEDPETRSWGPEGAAADAGFRSFSHCAYAAKLAGAPCNAADAAATAAAGTAASPMPQLQLQPHPASYVCGGGSLRGMCLPAGSQAPEHEQCVQFGCSKGLCGPPAPINEGRPCSPPGAAASSALPAAPPCRAATCRAGRCVAEPLPDGTACGPVGPCGEARCRAGSCVTSVEDDGVICGPSSACADWVCQAGSCVEERRPDGRVCWHAPGSCPRTCAAGRCVPCDCGPAYAFWAGSQEVDGLQWTPFPVDLRENSFGGYFNLLPEDLEIPPVQLPYNASLSAAAAAPAFPSAWTTAGAAGGAAAFAAASSGANSGGGAVAPSAIVVCSGCRLGMRLQAGAGMVQDGALLTGSVGLAASPVRGGTYVTLDVWLYPNASHIHLLTSWHPWAALSPPPLNAPHRWGDLSSNRGADLSPPPPDKPTEPPPPGALSAQASSAAGGGAGGRRGRQSVGGGAGELPRPVRQHSAWAFVRRRAVHWGFTGQEQLRSVFVGLHMTIASCSKAPPLSAVASSSAAAPVAAAPPTPTPAPAPAAAAAPAVAKSPDNRGAANASEDEAEVDAGAANSAREGGRGGGGGGGGGRRLTEAQALAAEAAAAASSPPRRIMAEAAASEG